jgi:hypothetical protein
MGTKITKGYSFGPSGQVTAALLHQMVDDATIQAGAIGTTELATGAVATGNIAAQAVTNAKLGADAVDGDKIADDAVDSEHIAAGAIDLEHFSPSSRPVTYDFGPASQSAQGYAGLVPAPLAGAQEKFLRADGWQPITEPINAAVAVAPGIAFSNHLHFI